MNAPLTPELFEKKFLTKPTVRAKAPGRIEVLGNHTDYNGGHVLSAAVDRHIELYLSENGTNQCQVLNPQFEDAVIQFDLTDLIKPLPHPNWLNYLRGILHELQQRGHSAPGFNITLQSNIPASAGMSSSAALEIAVIEGLDRLFALNLNQLEKALIGQACENNYIGANTGLMDQLTSLAGKQNQLLHSEYTQQTLSQIPFPDDLSFVVINSGVKHDLSQEYNDRRTHCEQATATLATQIPDLSSLTEVSLEVYQKHQSIFDETTYRRGLHIVSENDRVHRAIELLRSGNALEFGSLLFQSHKSSQQNFNNSCPELDQLVALAQASPTCLGARLSGGGFGGVSIHLVPTEEAACYAEKTSTAFSKQTNRPTQSYICQPSNGAQSETI